MSKFNNRDKKKTNLMRVDDRLIREHNEILNKRFSVGKELDYKKPQLTFRRFTSLITKNAYWDKIKKDFADLDKDAIRRLDKRGTIQNFTTIFLILLVIIAFGVVFALVGGILSYGFSSISSSLSGVTSTASTNISYYAGEVTFGNIGLGYDTLEWISWGLIMALFLGLLVSFFLIRVHPLFLVFYFIAQGIIFILSIILSRAYKQVHDTGGVLATKLASWEATSYVLLNMPTFVILFTFVGAIILFVSYYKFKEDIV